MKFKPHNYQKFLIEKLIKKPKLALFVDMGLGKTVCTLTAILDLMYERFKVGRVLVIAPLRVARKTWSDEIKKWDHLKDLDYSIAVGTEEERIAALNANVDVCMINRDNVKWMVDYFLWSKQIWPFDMLVIDESSSFKSHDSQRFKSLKKVAAITRRVVLLTGTPSPNGLIDLWSQIYLLDGGRRLRKTITAYRLKYFDIGAHEGHTVYKYELKPGADKEIYNRIKDITVSLRAKDHLKMPKRVDNIIKLELPKDLRKKYDQLEEDLIVELDNEEVVTAGSKAVVTNKLLQFANGAVYNEDKGVSLIHDIKLAALDEILDDCFGKPVLVVYSYKHDLSRLKSYLKAYKPRTLTTEKDEDDWNAGKIPVLLAHPASVGHGLNIQNGGSIIVWFGLTWSLELYQQLNARLFRQGQPHTVVINHLVMEGTHDEDVMARLEAKEITQDDLINAVRARIRARM
jgi:SNF2 family DNA or RNA helicase